MKTTNRFNSIKRNRTLAALYLASLMLTAPAVQAEKVVVIPLGSKTYIGASIFWTGAWRDNFQYVLGDGMQHGGSSYICVRDHVSSADNTPPNDIYWSLMAEKGGVKGDTGPTGPEGPAGPKGDQGDPGTNGTDGAKGDKGDPGTNGTDGAKGDKGDPGTNGTDGAKGDKGDPGTNGTNGAKGDKGDPGTNGTDGAKGDKGDPGTNGTDGAKGDKGDPGTNGTDGAKGDKGDPGTNGTDGAKGDKGDPGTNGTDGAKGDKGDPGTSSWTDDASNKKVTATVDVGIGAGAATPGAKLHVDGGVMLANDAAACAGSKTGTIRWSGTDFEGCNGTSWVSFTYTPVLIPTVTSATGQIWMDRNLGASQVATSLSDTAAYGDLYQWGRLADGHETRDPLSPTVATQSNGANPGHGNFIITAAPPYDWLDPQSGSLWQGASGTNNPCPAGFRLPTDVEWQAEINLYWATGTDQFNSPLKLVAPGYRTRSAGTLTNAGSIGYYWSSTAEGPNARFFIFNSGNGVLDSYSRGAGFSVRCLKD